MSMFTEPAIPILGIILILSSLGVILSRKPVHACLSFLLTLLSLASIYLQLSAEFIAVMQVIVYAGAILVIFMYVIVLFQDAYLKIDEVKSQSFFPFIFLSACAFLITFMLFAKEFINLPVSKHSLPVGFGSVESIGELLYTNFFFPFEAVIVLFLIAIVGSVYTARKGH